MASFDLVPVLKCSLQLRSGDTIPSNIPEQPSIQRSFCMITKSSLGSSQRVTYLPSISVKLPPKGKAYAPKLLIEPSRPCITLKHRQSHIP
ncbi:hypothetical protein L211DRAFT_223281 [Terfezia boudieri ATCC MYA-4762]|uniref:Uncharacterized protein n=1 Tax=Terfezia boudieri ATCC MYA-4762 TaxID=1051890 RepID=A0A3N4LLP4_9PEZI|nr:hypothetical protein L211DRAFT_223281 [Terfezia boudieri ATCC MYA-4762]